MDERARKISETMRAKGLDNFKEWRNEQKRLGNIKSEYPSLEQGGDLAELIGVVLGDGHIEAFPRTERLLLSLTVMGIQQSVVRCWIWAAMFSLMTMGRVF